MDIKFSKMYPKLIVPGHPSARIRRAKLLQVMRVEIRDLSKHFLAYDTNKNAYPLPDRGYFLLLIFEKIMGDRTVRGQDLFTTLRPYTPGKESYYKRCVGRIFNVEIVKPSSSRRPAASLGGSTDTLDSEEQETEKE